ncbi:MAG: FAD:protein FMN transferase [Deltaproteobacteria bacterium]|nr:FAD:protein FMN transferase [Deltaproteobacteria bacterium]
MRSKILFTLLFIPITASPSPQRFVREQLMMENIPVIIKITTDAKQKPKAFEAMEAAFNEARRLERELSEFQKESVVSEINRQAGKKWVKANDDLVHLLLTSGKVSALTRGAFDITFASKNKNASYRDVFVDTEGPKVFLKKPEMTIGVSGIAKGFIIDKMIETIRKNGFDNTLVNAGGDLKAAGEDSNGPWKIGIQDPTAPRGTKVCNLRLSNQAVATSGTYERGPHIIDPQTKQATWYWQSVTVFAEEAVFADGLATGGFVLGASAPSIFREIEGISAIFISPEGKVITIGNVTAACFE